MAVIGLVSPPMVWSGVRPPNAPPSTLKFVSGARGGRKVYPPLMKNCDCGTVAMGISCGDAPAIRGLLLAVAGGGPCGLACCMVRP